MIKTRDKKDYHAQIRMKKRQMRSEDFFQFINWDNLDKPKESSSMIAKH